MGKVKVTIPGNQNEGGKPDIQRILSCFVDETGDFGKYVEQGLFSKFEDEFFHGSHEFRKEYWRKLNKIKKQPRVFISRPLLTPG